MTGTAVEPVELVEEVERGGIEMRVFVLSSVCAKAPASGPRAVAFPVVFNEALDAAFGPVLDSLVRRDADVY